MYEFYDNNGVEYVRISIGADVVDRPATEADHAAAELANPAIEAAAVAAEEATAERVEREHANERRLLDEQATERVRLDDEKYAIQGRDNPDKQQPSDKPQPSDKQLEAEFDKNLATELAHKGEDNNGKHGKHKKSAE